MIFAFFYRLWLAESASVVACAKMIRHVYMRRFTYLSSMRIYINTVHKIFMTIGEVESHVVTRFFFLEIGSSLSTPGDATESIY